MPLQNSETPSTQPGHANPTTGAATLIHTGPAGILGTEPETDNRKPEEKAADERTGRVAVNTGMMALLLAFLVPALAPIGSIVALLRGIGSTSRQGQGLRGVIGIGLGAASLLCAALFWILWATLRPTPRVLIFGWAGLQHLPAVAVGIQHTREDPWGMSISSYQTGSHHRK